MALAGIVGVIATAVIIALIDIPKFENIENSKRYKAVYFTVLVLFVLIGAAQILIRLT